MKKVAVSLHATEDFSPEIIRNIIGLDYIHIDVMDGKFVKSTCLNLKVFDIIKQNYNIPILAHLMVINPIDYISKIVEKVYAIYFHYESVGDKSKLIELIHESKKKVGIALNPSTSILKVKNFLSTIEFVLILGVNPGYSGQKFIPSTIDKIRKLTKLKDDYHQFQIAVDGGITLENVKYLDKVDIISSTSAILNATNPNSTIELFKL